MGWPKRGRCINTNEIEALIQNIEVKDVCSFGEKTTTVDLITYACFRVNGTSGQCSPEMESWEFAEDCEKRVKELIKYRKLLFIGFLHQQEAGVPVSIKEYLDFLSGLDKGITNLILIHFIIC